MPQEDGSVVVDARLEIENLADDFGIEVPGGQFESVGGLMIHHLGELRSVTRWSHKI